jgi:S-adenosylmethionine:diacylglycerol 3-amino-3-carboxypropyl transferase
MTLAPETAWQGGRVDGRTGPPELLFGRMYEDSALELTAFAPGSRVFCIASAGCTAFDLAARGDEVTAVDINPAQTEYVRRRLAGEPSQQGTVDRRLDRLRRLAPTLGWRRSELERFCILEQPDTQLEFWRRHLDTHRFRLALAAAFHPRWLRRTFALPFVAVLPPRFDQILRRRLERGFGLHPNSLNPYAAALLLGRPREATPTPVRLVTADAAEFLEGRPPQSFDGLTLSNILDGAEEAYGARLFAAVRRVAAPGAAVVLRSFGEPSGAEEARRAADDRALFWGSIRVERL